MQAIFKRPFVIFNSLRTFNCKGLSITARFSTPTNNYGSYCKQAENWTSTKLKVHKATYAWTIDNFDFYEKDGTPVYSPVFSASSNDDAKWCLQVKPNGETDSKDTISLYVCLSKNSVLEKVSAWFYITIFNDEPKKEISKGDNLVSQFPSGSSGNGWGYRNFCTKDENFRKDFLSDNVLKMYCEVNYYVVEQHHHRNTPSLESTIAGSSTSENLATLSNNRVLEDLNISVNGKDYQAHKAILAKHSNVFAAMFDHDTKENQLNRIDIEDMSEEIVCEMLRFIYTGKCEKLDELAEGLLAAADKYDLAELKAICSESLCRNLSIENAAQTLILADKHNASELKSDVMKFIVANSAEVFDTEGWKNIRSYPVLIEEIVGAAVRR